MVTLPSLIVAKFTYYTESIYKLSKLERRVLGWLRPPTNLPELWDLEHNFLKILKADDKRIDLAKFAELEELNSRDPFSIA